MNLLGIDTSTRTAAAALSSTDAAGQERLLLRQRLVSTHSGELLGLIDELVREAQLEPRAIEAVVCGQGPGSFTGLRIGLATAKGLCLAIGCPLVMVSSLEALAARGQPGSRVCAVLDAYRGEVYAAIYRLDEEGVPVREGEEEAIAPGPLALRLAALGREQPVLLVGEGVAKYPELLVPGTERLDEQGGPGGAELLRLGARRLRMGEVADLRRAGPRYIRPSEAERAREEREKTNKTS